MKIATYNVNGIRAALKKGLLDWIKDGNYDIFCLQEVKANQEQVDNLDEILDLGYEVCWHSAVKKGYSGVATFWKKNTILPLSNRIGCGIDLYDQEGRIIISEFEQFTLMNCYFPSGTSGTARQEIKMKFLSDFNELLKIEREKGKEVIVVGDINIAHTEMDIHNPKSNAKKSGFLPEERAWISALLATDMVDVFRSQHPDEISYSWWSYRANARANNKGWRIDYQFATPRIAATATSAAHLKDFKQSDHCALVVNYNL